MKEEDKLLDTPEINILKKKTDIFCNQKIDTHVSLNDGFFKNGKILRVEKTFFLLEEFLTGQEFVFFLEVKDLSVYRKQQKEWKNLNRSEV